LNESACLYIDAKRLIEATDSLYHRISQFESRAREFEEIHLEEIQEFVFTQAEALIGTGARVLDPDDALEVLIKVYGYEKVVMALNEYEDGKLSRRKGTYEAA
jgi:hypothetical protein